MGNFAERLADIPGASSLFWLDELKSSKEVMIRLSNNAWVKAEADSDCMYAALLAVELIVETVKNSSKVKGTSLTSKLVTTLDKFNPKVNQDRIMIKTASVLDRFGNVKNNDVFKVGSFY